MGRSHGQNGSPGLDQLTARAVSLSYQDGLYLKSTDPTRLYLGTFLPYSTTQVDDLPAERGLWNFFNRVNRTLEVREDSMMNWTYNVPGTWRSPNGSDKMVRLVVGLPEDPLSAELYVNVTGGSSLYGIVGIGVDSNDCKFSNYQPALRTFGPLYRQCSPARHPGRWMPHVVLDRDHQRQW